MALDTLRADNVRFVVARNTDGVAVGTGALALFGDWAELKRMWVIPSARGRGVSKAILADLESRARNADITLIRLETGVRNYEAVALYTRAGFTRCEPFADYRPDPLSLFMRKLIG
jgi:putative acetyltransferase